MREGFESFSQRADVSKELEAMREGVGVLSATREGVRILFGMREKVGDFFHHAPGSMNPFRNARTFRRSWRPCAKE